MTIKPMSKSTKTNQTKMRNSTPPIGLFKAFVLLGGILLFGYALVVGFSDGNQPAMEKVDEVVTPLAEPQDNDYSKFKHSNPSHTRLPCLLCHRRDDNSPRIQFPGKPDHLPCAGCHAVQFSDNTSPMCNICHTDTGMKRFPGLRSFGAKFDHSRHTRANCATCHKTAGRGGAALSIPAGQTAHVTCFQCHTSRSSAGMVSCDVCHQPGRLIRTSESSPAFRKSFNHSEHLRGTNMNCATCHTVRPGASRGRQMSAPVTSMHFPPAGAQSCGACHNGKRAFGPDDFSNCKRCHSPTTFKF